MIPKFALGDPVVVTDQAPPVDGVIVDCSTWGKISSGRRCYRIRRETWIPPERWIDEDHLCLRKRPGLKLDYSHAFDDMTKDE